VSDLFKEFGIGNFHVDRKTRKWYYNNIIFKTEVSNFRRLKTPCGVCVCVVVESDYISDDDRVDRYDFVTNEIQKIIYTRVCHTRSDGSATQIHHTFKRRLNFFTFLGFN